MNRENLLKREDASMILRTPSNFWKTPRFGCSYVETDFRFGRYLFYNGQNCSRYEVVPSFTI